MVDYPQAQQQPGASFGDSNARDGSDSIATLTNLAELIGRQSRHQPDTVALVEPETPLSDPDRRRRTLTWAELDAQVDAVASGLAARGLVAGHRVALCGPNSIEFVVAYFAALRAGYVVVPLNPHSSTDELAAMTSHAGCRLVLMADESRVDANRGDAVPTVPLTEEGLSRLAASGSGPPVSPPDREALALLLYTAGTSAEAKAAMLTHRALLSHLEQFDALNAVDDASVVLVVLPLFHVFGLNAVLGSWAASGATAVVMDEYGPDLFGVVAEEGVTNLPVAPSLLYRMLQDPAVAEGLSGVTSVISGAAPLPRQLGEEFTERTGLRVEQGYGLTEAAPGVAATFGGEIHGSGHVGRPVSGVSVRIGGGAAGIGQMGDGDDESEPGEIWIRGDNLFSGYWPDAHGGPDGDGWFPTGDVGYLADGELYLVDRSRDLIIVNGFNVYPAEVEQAVRGLAGVEEVAVIGTPDEASGEAIVAFVVGNGVTADLVQDYCAHVLARFKQPTQVRMVSELPRGVTGKIRKGALRQLLTSPG